MFSDTRQMIKPDFLDVDRDVSAAYFKCSLEKATVKDLALLVFVAAGRT